MPANLNALIRYKTIDRCLAGGKREHRIRDLVEACSEALGENRGIYGVSERTIRDDIRVMRSNMLGFNAPIKQRHGYYYYSDPHYTIFNSGTDNQKVLTRILDMLIRVKEEIQHPGLDEIITQLKRVVYIVVEEAAMPVGETMESNVTTERIDSVTAEEPEVAKISVPEDKRPRARVFSIIEKTPSKVKQPVWRMHFMFQWSTVLKYM